MKVLTLLLAVAWLDPIHVSAQASKGDKGNDLSHNDIIIITGCMTKNSHKEFELVDQEGFDNLPYSTSVHLDEYVGQTVTLVGRRGATPSYETNANLKTHFLVRKVQSASGQCKE